MTRGCTHYSWKNINGGTCYIHSGRVPSVVKVTDKTAMCGAYWIDLDLTAKGWDNSCDFSNNARFLKVTKAATHSACIQSCLETPSCSLYTWNADNGGTCNQRNGVPNLKSAFFNNENSICGYVSRISSLSAPNCGRRPLSTRIVGGTQVAVKGDWSWTVRHQISTLNCVKNSLFNVC